MPQPAIRPTPTLYRLRQLLATALLGTLLVSAQAQTPPDPAVEAAIRSFLNTPESDSSQSSTATELQQLSSQRPTDPRLMAYAGAATSRLARTTLLPWRKMRYADDGLAMIDKALLLIRPEHELAPAGAVPPALDTRLVAASTFLAVPGMFNRSARGEKLLADLLQHPALPGLPPEFRSAVYFLAGEHAQKNQRPDEARRHYERVIQLRGPKADAARAALKGLSS